MKDYFNWIGCKSSKKERYIQLAGKRRDDDFRCKSSKKERYIQLGVVLALLNGRCTSSKKIGTSNFFALV